MLDLRQNTSHQMGGSNFLEPGAIADASTKPSGDRDIYSNLFTCSSYHLRQFQRPEYAHPRAGAKSIEIQHGFGIGQFLFS